MRAVIFSALLIICINFTCMSQMKFPNKKSWDKITHDANNTENEEKLLEKQERLIIYSSVIIILLISALAVGLLFRYRFVKKTYRILKSKNDEIESKNQELEKLISEREYLLALLDSDLNKAYIYMLSLISPPIKEGKIKANWKFVPSMHLGGDCLGYHWLDNENIAIYIIDVAGHGLGPAIHAVSILNLIKNESLPDTDFLNPSQVLNSLNKIFQMNKYNELFFTMCYSVYNIKDRKLKYCSAGHPPALLFNNGSYEFIEPCNFIVGGSKDIKYETCFVEIPKNSELYFYSDGAYEIQIDENNMLTYNDMAEFLKKNRNQDGLELERLYSYLLQVQNQESLNDDFSILKISID